MCEAKKPVPTEEDLKEMQAMNELLEKVRQWEKYYWANETAEQRKQRESIERMKGFIQIFKFDRWHLPPIFSANYWTVVFF